MRPLGTLRTDNQGDSIAWAISANGRFVVGEANWNGSTNIFMNRAFYWDADTGVMRDIGTHRSNDTGGSVASGITPDGRFVVGSAETDDGPNRAFRWDAETEIMQDLGSLRDDNKGFSSVPAPNGSAISAGGRFVVGEAETDDGPNRAFRWDADTEIMQDLGSHREDNLGASIAWEVTPDGRFVVGSAETDDGPNRAFRWDAETEIMQDLGSHREDKLGISFSRGISADGRFVVGSAETEDGPNRAFRWDAATGNMLDLGSLRADNLGSSFAADVSEDGSVVVGTADTDQDTRRAFIWRTQMQDFENLMLSFPVLANDTEIAVAQQQNIVGRLMDQTCLAEAGQACLTIGGEFASTGNTAAQGIGKQSGGTLALTYGRGLDGRITLGGTISLSNASLGSNGFDLGNAVGVSLWGEYSQGGLARTGWQAGAAIGWGHANGEITRGRGFDNVMLATGEADLTTTSARVTVGYGFQQQDWLITPSITLAHFSTDRSAYAEAGADFNATYDELSVERTTATLAVTGEYKLSEQSTLLLGLGLEHDLSADRVMLTGTNTVPGMDTFAVSSTLERRTTRGFLDIGYSHDLGNGRSLSGALRVGQAAFGTEPQITAGVNYSMRF